MVVLHAQVDYLLPYFDISNKLSYFVFEKPKIRKIRL